MGFTPDRHPKDVSDAEKIRNLILASIPTCWKRRFKDCELTSLHNCLRAICRGGIGALVSGGIKYHNVREVVNSIPQIYYSWTDSIRYEAYNVHCKIMAKKLMPC